MNAFLTATRIYIRIGAKYKIVQQPAKHVTKAFVLANLQLVLTTPRIALVQPTLALRGIAIIQEI